jgi:putative sterol carrier protein
MRFATQAWADAFRAEIEASTTYRRVAASWKHGPVVYWVRAAPSLGLPSPIGLWLDLVAGRCRAARIIDEAEADRVSFCISGDYRDWKAVIRRQLDPIKAIMTRRLELRGSMFTLLRYVAAAMEMVACAQRVPAEFADETSAQGAPLR